jgi:uncharacterized integral membrane protein (TIGR00698 family)
MSAPVPQSVPAQFASRLFSLLPGLALSFGLALFAVRVRDATGIAALNPVVVALVAGIALSTLTGLPGWLRPGVAFAVRPVLRAAIVLLGLQVTAGQLLSVGAGALGLAFAAVACTIPFAAWLGRLLRVPRRLALLIGTGTGICGASAIVAANQVVRGEQEDVAYALAVITLCGTASLLIYPVLFGVFGLDPHTYGLWAGSSLHEVVQAVGAAEAGGPVAVQLGTITKLARVVMLAPAVLALGIWLRRGTTTGQVKAPMPWFALGFLAMVAAGSSGVVPSQAVAASRFAVPLMMAASVAALGLNTSLRALHAHGIRPLALGIGTTLFIALLGLTGATLL